MLKTERRITHYKKLKSSSVDGMEYFWSQAETLGDFMGPVRSWRRPGSDPAPAPASPPMHAPW